MTNRIVGSSRTGHNIELQRRFAMRSYWISRTVAAVTAIGLTLLLATGARAQNAGPKPTVVLVHGGFSDASVWDAVITQLQDDGFPVIAPANPLRGALADSAYLASVLDTLGGPLILAAHSYGGIVISNAAAMTRNAQNIQALVFVAAFIPDVGEQGQNLTPLPGSLIGPALQGRLCPVASCPAGAELYIDPAQFRKVLAGDLSPGQTNVLAAAQRGISPTASTEASEFAAWHTVPSFAIVSTQDNAIGVANERVMARRAQAKTVEVQASHFVIMSEPDAVVSLIESAAAQR
jgi:pimeloyl-ACP methyl ester carboxylesterase